MDKLKTYFIEVVVKNVSPKVISAVMAYGVTFIIAHQQFMEQMGITYYDNFTGIFKGPPPTGQLLIVEFDTLGKWGAFALVAGATAVWAFFQHHAVATITGAPQSGNVRTEPEQPVVGGSRQGDPNNEPKAKA